MDKGHDHALRHRCILDRPRLEEVEASIHSENNKRGRLGKVQALSSDILHLGRLEGVVAVVVVGTPHEYPVQVVLDIHEQEGVGHSNPCTYRGWQHTERSLRGREGSLEHREAGGAHGLFGQHDGPRAPCTYCPRFSGPAKTQVLPSPALHYEDTPLPSAHVCRI